MKIISATTETPGMTKEQVNMFLEGKFMLQMSTLDEKGEPISNLFGFTMIRIAITTNYNA